MATAATTTAAARPETLHRCPTCKGTGVEMDGDEAQLCACNVDEATRRTHAFRMFNLIPVGRGTLGRLSDRGFRTLAPARREALITSMQQIAQFFGFEDVQAVLHLEVPANGYQEIAADSWRTIHGQLCSIESSSRPAAAGRKAA